MKPVSRKRRQRLIVAMTGATGSIYGVRILETLRAIGGWETHLIVSDAGALNAWYDHKLSRKDLAKLADVVHNVRDVGASIASGSFQTDGMVIAPCSVNTMSAIATGVCSNLLLRAADVTLKERRPLILMVRESPLHLGHLRTMVALAEMGAVIAPPVPGFYHQPATILDLVDHSVDRVLDLLGAPSQTARRWDGAVNRE